MNIEDQVREAIVAELRRQSEASQQGLRVKPGEAEMITIEGRVNLDELTMAVVGSLAGGP
jgi:tetrahydromethanopterin S-methyltransferase subunit A